MTGLHTGNDVMSGIGSDAATRVPSTREAVLVAVAVVTADCGVDCGCYGNRVLPSAVKLGAPSNIGS